MLFRSTTMTKIFLTVDVIVALVLVGVEAIVILRYLKKKKAVSAE